MSKLFNWSHKVNVNPRTSRMNRILTVLTLLAVSGAATGQALHEKHSPYAGEESRAIKSLSPEDIAEIRAGGGWGLAKTAELNGLPGPIHLLELKDEIELTPEQVDAITGIYEHMRAKAIAEGERYISYEQTLEEAFRATTVTEKDLRELLGNIERSRARLRFIHLAAHLETPNLLTETQIERYDALRGYHTQRGDAAHSGHEHHNH